MEIYSFLANLIFKKTNARMCKPAIKKELIKFFFFESPQYMRI